MPALLILLAAMISGAAALSAEVVWFRALGRGVGTSAEALAVVSAAFLGGLGIGAAIASRLAPRSKASLRAAAVCECVAGALVFLSPFALAWVPDLHLAVLHAFGLPPGPSSWPAALVSLPILVLPTSFLGATLPFLVRNRVATAGHAGRWTGWLYGLNTLGAAVGAAAAVWVLLPRLGESASLRTAGAANVLAALLFLLADRPARRPDSVVEGEGEVDGPFSDVPEVPEVPDVRDISEAPETPETPEGRRTARAANVALFASGALALAGEVAWFRLLEPVTGVHLFGLVFLLVPVLLGTAIGGALGGFVADRVRRPDLALAVTVAFGGLLTAASVALAGAIPTLVLSGMAATPKADAQTLKVLCAALCVVPPLMAFACAYPLAVRARATSSATAARAAGSVYAWNTAGNVAGSLLGGFLILPGIGGPRALAAIGGMGLIAGAALWLFARRPRPAPVALLLLLPVLPLALPGAGVAVDRAGPRLPEVVALSNWSSRLGRVRSREDMEVFSEVYGGTYPTPPWRPGAEPVLPREGRISSVGLLLERRWVKLRQGGLSESVFKATDPDAGSDTEVCLALIPVLVHPDPRIAFVIGHGAGWTVETLLASQVERVDVAELEPAVLDVVEEYRGPLAVRHDPKAHLFVTDGRLVLREAAAEGGRYDVIASQPSHPWVPGAGHLFTVEAYEMARRALRPGGVFAQWLNIFDMSRETFQTALSGWLQVFPESWLFLFNNEVVLVGFTATPRIDVERWETALAAEPIGMRARAAGILGPGDVLKRFMLDARPAPSSAPPRGIARLVPPGTVPTTDDDPRLEIGLSRIRMRGGAEVSAINDAIRAAFPPDLAAAIPDPTARTRWVVATVHRLLDDDRPADAKRWLDRVSFGGGSEGKRLRAREARRSDRRGGLDDAETLLRLAMNEAPDDPRPVEDLLDLLLHAGRNGDAAEVGTTAAGRFPRDGKILASLANALVRTDERDRAAQAFAAAQEATEPPPPPGSGHDHARLLLTFEPPQHALARDSLRADPATYSDLGALDELIHLEIEIGTDDERHRLEALRDALRREKAREKTDKAYGWVYESKVATGLDAAREATDLAPDGVEAWRLRGILELREGHPDAAARSFSRAVEAAGGAEAERRRARAWLRMFGAPEDLPVPEAP